MASDMFRAPTPLNRMSIKRRIRAAESTERKYYHVDFFDEAEAQAYAKIMLAKGYRVSIQVNPDETLWTVVYRKG